MNGTDDDPPVEEPRSVILAIFSAKNDLENQIVLKMARKADPAGQRTMGKSIGDHLPIENSMKSRWEQRTSFHQLILPFTQVSSPNLTVLSVVREMKSGSPI